MKMPTQQSVKFSAKSDWKAYSLENNFFHRQSFSTLISPRNVTLLMPLIFIFLSFTYSYSQEQGQDIAPPPIKTLTKNEQTQLKAETEVKNRTKLSLDLMDARLTKAEESVTKEDYREVFDELGGFHALMDNTLEFLFNRDTNKGKVVSNFKRVEMNLRKYATRLELIRRALPVKYEFYVRKLVQFVRDARAKAIEPMFSDTVLPDDDSEK